MTALGLGLCAAAALTGLGGVKAHARGGDWRPYAAVSYSLTLVASLLWDDWLLTAACAVLLILLGGDWYRRNGKRAARAAGAKARAVIERMTRALREAGTPVPEGARA